MRQIISIKSLELNFGTIDNLNDQEIQIDKSFLFHNECNET